MKDDARPPGDDHDDTVFKALADASRRGLLDLLFERDGQTLAELHAHLPMTRFGVMKHLQVLEEAGLLTTRKVGREKHHYLNPVPIELVYGRWVSKYAQPWTRTLAHLKQTLEEPGMTDTPAHVFEVYIRTTPEQLWAALTDGTLTPHYYWGSRVESTWEVGAPYRYLNRAGAVFLDGEVREIDPPRRLVTTFRPLWDGATGSATPSLVTWEIEPLGPTCKLTVTHSGLIPGDPQTRGITSEWARILSGLKTYLETGESLMIEM